MSHEKQTLADRVADRCSADATFTPAAADALRLAEMFDDIKPQEFFVPTSDGLEAYRPFNENRMLVRAT